MLLMIPCFCASSLLLRMMRKGKNFFFLFLMELSYNARDAENLNAIYLVNLLNESLVYCLEDVYVIQIQVQYLYNSC